MKTLGIVFLVALISLTLIYCGSGSDGETKTFYVSDDDENDNNDNDTSNGDDDDNGNNDDDNNDNNTVDNCYFDPANCLELTNYVYGICEYNFLRFGEYDEHLMTQQLFKTLCDRVLLTQLDNCLWEAYQSVKDVDDGHNGCTFFPDLLEECLLGNEK